MLFSFLFGNKVRIFSTNFVLILVQIVLSLRSGELHKLTSLLAILGQLEAVTVGYTGASLALTRVFGQVHIWTPESEARLPKSC